MYVLHGLVSDWVCKSKPIRTLGSISPQHDHRVFLSVDVLVGRQIDRQEWAAVGAVFMEWRGGKRNIGYGLLICASQHNSKPDYEDDCCSERPIEPWT